MASLKPCKTIKTLLELYKTLDCKRKRKTLRYTNKHRSIPILLRIYINNQQIIITEEHGRFI